MSPLPAHRLWAATYDSTPNPLLALEQRILEPLLPPLTGALAVDVACGSGRWARRLTGANVVTIDLCPEMLLRAPGLRVLAHAGMLPLPDAIADLTICAFALSYTEPCLDELARITRPGGTVIISDMHPSRAWSRSFRTAEGVVEILTRPYLLADLRGPGLTLETIIEAPFGEPERPIFDQAGKVMPGGPAVYIAQFTRHATR